MKKHRILPRLEDVTEVLTKNPKLLLNEKNNYTAEKWAIFLKKNFLNFFLLFNS